MRHFSLLLAACFTQLALAADWPTFQGNQYHTGYVPTGADLAQLQEAWSTSIPNNPYFSGIAVGYGRVYVTHSQPFGSSRMSVLSRTTGQPSWAFDISHVNSLNPPALANGRVYFQTGNHEDDTYLRCHDAITGAYIFRVPHTAQWNQYLAPTVVDGTVYVHGGTYGGMYAFTGASGDLRWFRPLNQFDKWTPAVDANYCITYLGGYPGGLNVVNRSDGAVAFFIPDTAYTFEAYSLGSSVAMEGNTCYVTNGNRLLKFDIGTRKIAWQKTRNYSGQVTVGPTALYVNDGGAVTAVNKTNGSFLWQAQSSHGNLMGPMIVTDSFLIAQTQSHTVLFDLTTHAEVWAAPVSGPMALSDDVLYIAGSTINSYALYSGPHELAYLSLSRASVAGANSVLATVHMTSRATRNESVAMWDDTQLISTPPTAVVREGSQSASVRLSTAPVAVTGIRTIYARFEGITKSAQLKLLPHGPSAIELYPSTFIHGGTTVSIKVVLNGPAGYGQTVQLSSDSPYASFPSSISIPAGSAVGYGVFETTAPPQAVVCRITARIKGVSAGATITITP